MDLPDDVIAVARELSGWNAVRAEQLLRSVRSLRGRGEIPSPNGPISGNGFLESVFWMAWTQAQALGVIPRSFGLKGQVDVSSPGRNDRWLDWAVLPPTPDDQPRSAASVDALKVAIELDGYQTHHGTPAAVIKQYRRDVILQSQGWFVLHFLREELVQHEHGICELGGPMLS